MADTIDTKTLREAYVRDGYVIVDGIFAGKEKSMEQLRSAAADVVALTLRGDWPHRRVVGKQYPPYDEVTQDYWGVQHLMHPSLPHHELFAQFYASSPLLDVAAALLGAPEERVQLELFNLLVNPEKHAFALGWHRDDVRPELDEEEEKKVLATETFGIQWNAALYDDECLFIIPGTHTRTRTPAERAANLEKPPPERLVATTKDGKIDADGVDGSWEIDPPTTKRVMLKAGQTAFYSQRILHRASYLPTKQRATLHGCYGDVGADAGHGASSRARNILQHGLAWMRDPAFGAGLPPRLRPMWQRLLEMESRFAGQELGYSLEG